MNVGSNNPVNLKTYVKTLEKILGKKANKINYPLQKGDVKHTHANITKLNKIIRFYPKKHIDIFDF